MRIALIAMILGGTLLTHVACAFAPLFQYVQKFKVTLPGGEVFDAYVTKPRDLVEHHFGGVQGRWNLFQPSFEVPSMAVRAARFIDDRSWNMGHVNFATMDSHTVEMNNIGDGEWPSVVFTRRGQRSEVVFAFAIAIRRGIEDYLPYHERFYESGSLSEEETAFHIVEPYTLDQNYGVVPKAHDPDFFYPLVVYDPLKKGFVFDELTPLVTELPWFHGKLEVEIKHMTLAKGAPRGLVKAGHALTSGLGLHRDTAYELNYLQRDNQMNVMRRQDVATRFAWRLRTFEKKRLEQCRSDEERRSVSQYFARMASVLWSERGFQKHFAVDTISLQVSEPLEQEGSLDQYFIRAFNIPPTPVHDILEKAPWGTPGIRTLIHKMSIRYFDTQVLGGMDAQTGALAEGILFEPEEDEPREMGFTPHCDALLVNLPMTPIPGWQKPESKPGAGNEIDNKSD